MIVDAIVVRDRENLDHFVKAIGATRTSDPAASFFGVPIVTDPDIEPGTVWLAVRCARGSAVPCSVCAGKGYMPVQRFKMPEVE